MTIARTLLWWTKKRTVGGSKATEKAKRTTEITATTKTEGGDLAGEGTPSTRQPTRPWEEVQSNSRFPTPLVSPLPLDPVPGPNRKFSKENGSFLPPPPLSPPGGSVKKFCLGLPRKLIFIFILLRKSRGNVWLSRHPYELLVHSAALYCSSLNLRLR